MGDSHSPPEAPLVPPITPADFVHTHKRPAILFFMTAPPIFADRASKAFPVQQRPPGFVL